MFLFYRKEDNKDMDSEKEAAMEAEIKAARERAIVPLEARMKQFKDMLLERGVRKILKLKLYEFFKVFNCLCCL